jgi:hypothetical protein
LCVGDDWAEDHHGIEVMDEAGRVLVKKRLPEGVAGIGQLHELIGQFVPAHSDVEVQVGPRPTAVRGWRADRRGATRCSR